MADEADRLIDDNARLRNAMLDDLPSERCQAVQRELARIAGLVFATPQVGDTAPTFELANVHGYRVALSEQLEAGPVVLSFFRGTWCSFCLRELRALQRRLPQIEALGARLLAISPQASKRASRAAERYHLGYEILVDAGNRVASAYGLLQPTNVDLADFDERYQVDLAAQNADGAADVPVPATFLLQPDGTVYAQYVCADWTRRMDPDAIVDLLRAIQSA